MFTFVTMFGVGDWIIRLAPAQVSLDVAVRTLNAFAIVGFFTRQARQFRKNIKITLNVNYCFTYFM